MTYVPNCVFKSSSLKATDIFVILLSQDGFKSNCPETKLQSLPKVISEELFKEETLCNRKTPVLEFLSNNVTSLKAANFIKKRLQTGVLL